MNDNKTIDSVLQIRDYNNIRSVLRAVYIYGCFTKTDFVKNGVGQRKYDNEKARILQYLPDNFIQERTLNRNKVMYCSYSMEDWAQNYLANTYRNKSFTLLEYTAYFYILQILSDGEKKSELEILDEISDVNTPRIFEKNNLLTKLVELEEASLIEKIKEGNNVYYRLADDIWENFTDEELQEIYLFLDFLMNVCPIELPYYFLKEKLWLYMVTEREIDQEKYDSLMQYKHSHLFNVLDNEIILTILQAIHQKMKIEITIKKAKTTIVFDTVPIRLIHDCSSGRQYLVTYWKKRNSTSVLRIDRILDATIKEEISPDIYQAAEESLLVLDNCWCTSIDGRGPAEVVIDFHFDEKQQRYMLKRIYNECHGAAIEQLGEGHYRMTKLVSDPKEMIPWIRSFGERAKVISSGAYRIEDEIRDNWLKAVKNYEALS